MPIDIKVLENQRELDSIEESVYLILRYNQYNFFEDQERVEISSAFAVFDYKNEEELVELRDDGNFQDNLEEFAKVIKAFGEEKFYTFPTGYLHDEYKLGPNDKLIFLEKKGLGEITSLVYILNKEYNEIMSRQLCFNF